VKELSKSIPRRASDSRFLNQYFCGEGIDIGGKPDPLSLYQSFFPKMKSVRIWDLEDGDAQYLSGVSDDTFDFVHSSHTLEHMEDPFTALRNWFRVLSPGGHLIVTLPDEDLYEQGNFHEKFNRYHNYTFTIAKKTSWSDHSVNIVDMVLSLGGEADVKLIQVCDEFYRYDLPRFDQTRSPLAECAIEFVVRKRPISEINGGGRLPHETVWPNDSHRYFLQYQLDQKAAAEKYPEPFGETK
jgi:SAM-dependent methyltransferase